MTDPKTPPPARPRTPARPRPPARATRVVKPTRIARLTAVVDGGVTGGRAAGKARRAEVPRSSHQRWVAADDRPDPIAFIDATNRSRLADLIPVRWGRMLASPFTFFRGAPAMMAFDLSRTPSTGIHVQACGDAHLVNFGLFGTPERQLVFDVNDFDETLPAPWEWDVKRLAASFVVAARSSGLTEADGEHAVTEAVRGYRVEMARLTELSMLEIWYEPVLADHVVALLKGDERRVVVKTVAKSRANTALRAVDRLTEVVDGHRRFIESPPTTTRLIDAGAATRVKTVFNRYLESMPDDRRMLLGLYEFVDVARKVVGVGSVGTRCFVGLLEGRVAGAPLLLQVKEATPSILEPFVGRSEYAEAGQRVVAGQRITQAASDLFLGWTRLNRHHYYVRQLRDMKGGVDVEAMAGSGLAAYGTLCGTTLARAHARTGVASQISGYLGNSDMFDQSVARFAVDYADQNERDHAALVEAVATGRIEAITGV